MTVYQFLAFFPMFLASTMPHPILHWAMQQN